MGKHTKKKSKVVELLGSHEPTPLAKEAIRQLLRTKERMKVLSKRHSFLCTLIMQEGCGYYEGVRTYIYHRPEATRVTRVKAQDILKVVKDSS